MRFDSRTFLFTLTVAPWLPAASAPADALETIQLAPYVVVGSRVTTPLESVLDPSIPAQPLPAQDGADVLKSIPGFSVIRKGGTDGDPVFRGMAGSRLGIQVDGQIVLGGCSSRMDPPTAYVFPTAYDRVRILKGPQTVLHGPGQSAGLVLFEADPPLFTSPGARIDTHTTVGNGGRLDLGALIEAGSETGFATVQLTRTESSDYEDGDGNPVHSHHLRWSARTALGWTPDADTLVQLSAIASDGEAAYADRMMDGAAFDRQSVSLRARRDRVSRLLARVEFELGLNSVDHVMDTFSLREFVPTFMMPHPTVSNPDRRTLVSRARLDLTPGDDRWAISLGLDYQADRHRNRGSMNQTMMPYEEMARVKDATFSQVGAFGETTHHLGDRQRVVAGFRLDRWSATDHRETIRIGMMSALPNPTAGRERTQTLASGFVRYEHDLAEDRGSIFAGLGHVARFLDYWELIRNESPDSLSAFSAEPERTTQLDLGATLRLRNDLELSVSTFLSRIEDFALVQNNFAKPSGMMGSRPALVTRGIEASTYGGEVALAWHPGDFWRFDANMAYTRGENESDGRPLAQIPPLESRLSITYLREAWSAGTILRGVAKQERVAIGEGNIVGQDFGPSDAFATLALHASWTPSPSTRLSAGVDNLFDTTYAEHLSRSGAAVPGYPQTTRVNEPGRTLWARFDLSF